MNNDFSHNVILNFIEELKRDKNMLQKVETSPAQAEMEIKALMCNMDIEPKCTYSGALIEENQTIFLQTTSSYIIEKLQEHIKKLKENAASERSEAKQDMQAEMSTRSPETAQRDPGSATAETAHSLENPEAAMQPEGPAPKVERFNPAELNSERTQNEGLGSAAPTTYAPASAPASMPASAPASPMANGRLPKFSISIPKSKLEAYKNDPEKDKNTVMFEIIQMVDNQLRTQFINPNAVYKNVNFSSAKSPVAVAIGSGKTIGRALSDIFYAEVYGASKSQTINKPNAPNQQTAAPTMQQGFTQNPAQYQSVNPAVQQGVTPVAQQTPVQNPAYQNTNPIPVTSMGQTTPITQTGPYTPTTEGPTADMSNTNPAPVNYGAPTPEPMGYGMPETAPVNYGAPTAEYTTAAPVSEMNAGPSFTQPITANTSAYAQGVNYNIYQTAPQTTEVNRQNFKSFDDKVLLDMLVTDTATNGNMPSDLYNDILNYLISPECKNYRENVQELNNKGISIPMMEMNTPDSD